jgi:hypothetical protein
VSNETKQLALHRDLLVARASLQRLRMAHDARALGQALRGPGALLAAASSPPGRAVLFGVAMMVLGRGRVSRAVRIAAAALAVVKLARTLRSRPAVDRPRAGGSSRG